MDESPHQGEVKNDLQNGGALLKGSDSVGELFSKSAHLFATRTSEAFEAVYKGTGERVVLWLLRYPLAEKKALYDSFITRIENLKTIGANIPKILAYGVDGRGMAFVALEYSRTRNIFEQAQVPKTMERTFIEILQLIAKLHEKSFVLGDISLDSLLVDERGALTLLAFLGPFESAAKQTAILPPPETLVFLAPEQRTSGEVGTSTDVFALGVYGYRLFTGQFPATSEGDLRNTVPAPSSIRSDLPIWVDDVLGRCLDPIPGNRFSDAGAVLEVILESLRSGAAPGGASRWSHRTLIVSSKARNEVIKPKALSKQGSKELSTNVNRDPASAQSIEKVVKTFSWAFVFLILVLSGGLVYVLHGKMKFSSVDPDESVLLHTEYAPPELRQLIFDATAESIPIEKRKLALTKISESKDPIAYAVLLSFSKGKYENSLKRAAETLLVDRVESAGLKKSASVLRKWIQDIEKGPHNAGDVPIYGLLLRSCDQSRPLEVRQQALREAAKQDAVVGMRLAAALALDESEEHFTPTLRLLLLETSPSLEVESHGVGALILSNQILSKFFEPEMVEMIPKFTDEDLKWGMLQLSGYDNLFVNDLAKEVLNRRALPPYQAVFLRTLVESGKFQIPPAVQKALIRAALGKLGKDELYELARWMSIEVETVLLAAAATAADPKIATEAFEILAGRSLQTQPADSLVKFVKSQFWDYRDKAAKAIGILGLIDIAGDEDLEFALNQLLPFASAGSSLFRVIVATDEPRLITRAVEKLGNVTAGEELISLLSNKDKNVRIQAVRALKGRNDLVTLQGILREYNREKDPDVRAIYREIHWVTQDRDGTKQTVEPASPSQ